MIAQGTDGTNPMDEEWIDTIKGINVYTADELESYLLEAGFKSVEIFKYFILLHYFFCCSEDSLKR